jgi:hypothetical protein
VSQFDKLEISFQVVGSAATDMQWPYDPAPPNGVPSGTGISVDAIFTDPMGRQFAQPAFYSEVFLDEVRDGRDWHLPTGTFEWRVRFTPNLAGVWSYRLTATDRSGSAESGSYHFNVDPSARKGFLRVSEQDTRYFEFDDRSMFHGMGFEFNEYPDFLGNPTTEGTAKFADLKKYGANFTRVWIGSVYGSAWPYWIGGRNQYGGYLPHTGLEPVRDPASGETRFAMQLDYEPEGDVGWFDACRMQFWNGSREESVKPHTTYRIRVQYRGTGITGPRRSTSPSYGLVAKIGGWFPDCYEPGTSTVVTTYGGDTSGYGYVEGTWYSGSNNFLPRIYLGLENVHQGTAWVQSVSLREDLGGGSFGPEMMTKPSMELERYIAEERAYALDKFVELAERNDVYLKLVLMEKGDTIYYKLDDNGEFVTSGDNQDGFYGLGRAMNKTRWLQQMWWRYAQARWGYSPNIHSWELTNEGDPFLASHYELADELGKFMHCRVFGVEPGAGDAAKCQLAHPNAHLVTTSLWHSFPAQQFWMNGKYPNLDYADVHAYVSTSFAPLSEREAMQWDAAYYHTWHSEYLAGAQPGMPIVRGEAGLDSPTLQSPTAIGVNRDVTGVWLHNYLWSGLHSGGLHEIYWWNDHIWDATADRRRAYNAVQGFLADVPLNAGGYADWGGTVSNPALRVVGQKNVARGALHVWVQNRQHTWKNVVDGLAITSQSGEIVVPGFTPGGTYAVQRWDTGFPGGLAESTNVTADAAGALRITVSSLGSDTAFKIPGSPETPPPPRVPTNVRIVR